LADALLGFPATNHEGNQKSHDLRAQPRDLQFHSTGTQMQMKAPRFVIPTGGKRKEPAVSFVVELYFAGREAANGLVK